MRSLLTAVFIALAAACIALTIMPAQAFTPTKNGCLEDEARDKRGVCRWVPDPRSSRGKH